MRAISLFSGMGGDSLGMKQAGINVVAYSEINKTFCETHDKNFPDCELIGNDIKEISDEDFLEYKNKIDILLAGFPCQSYSNAGKKKADDPRGQLYLEFVRATKLVNPKIIIGENVAGLLTRKMTDGTLFIDSIVKDFENLGYQMSYKVLKASDFNTPQTRDRLIILGSKDKVLTFPEPISENPDLKNIVKFHMEGAMKIPKDIFDFTTIPEECILTDEDNEEEEDEDNIHPYLKLKASIKDAEYTYQKKTKELSSLLSFGKRESPISCEIIDIRKPSKTIICTYDHQPRLYVPLKNKNGYYVRCLRVKELKQIQGFPKNYKLEGTKKDKIIQIGNAVPPPLIKAVVEHILK